MASGEYRRQWHKYLPPAVLNYNTTYHSSIGCEASKFFHGLIPYNVLGDESGNTSNKYSLPTTEFAEEVLRRTQFLIDQLKKIMQSYLKYEKYYDCKARAAPLQENDYCLFLDLKRIAKVLKYHSGATCVSVHSLYTKLYQTITI